MHLRRRRQHQISKKRPHVVSNGPIKRKLGVDDFEGITCLTATYHQTARVQITMQHGLGVGHVITFDAVDDGFELAILTQFDDVGF